MSATDHYARACPGLLLLACVTAAPLDAAIQSDAADDASADGPASDELALRWERFELPNGLEVVLLPDSARDEVAVELWTHAGTRHEPVGKYGLAHFFEHALPHGALMRAGAVVEAADSLRTGSNARTRDDYTRYYPVSYTHLTLPTKRIV